jgi:hypothetical protein
VAGPAAETQGVLKGWVRPAKQLAVDATGLRRQGPAALQRSIRKVVTDVAKRETPNAKRCCRSILASRNNPLTPHREHSPIRFVHPLTKMIPCELIYRTLSSSAPHSID